MVFILFNWIKKTNDGFPLVYAPIYMLFIPFQEWQLLPLEGSIKVGGGLCGVSGGIV
jgi:hypothetical protein